MKHFVVLVYQKVIAVPKTAFVLLGLSVCVVAGAFLVQYHAARVAEYHSRAFVKILDASTEKTFLDLDGKPVSLASYLGKPFVLFLWGSWCPSCGDALTLLSRVYTETQLPIVALNRKENPELIRDYLSFIHTPQGLTYVIDTEDVAFRVSSGYSAPEFIVYDEKGREIAHIHGTFTEEEVRAILMQVNKK